MSCLESVSTCITQGNDWFFDVTLTQDGLFDPETNLPSAPLNITGATIELTLKPDKDSPATITPAVNIGDPLNGQVTFSLTSSETESLISSSDSVTLFGAPKITYQDGTIEDLFRLQVDIFKSWN